MQLVHELIMLIEATIMLHWSKMRVGYCICGGTGCCCQDMYMNNKPVVVSVLHVLHLPLKYCTNYKSRDPVTAQGCGTGGRSWQYLDGQLLGWAQRSRGHGRLLWG